MTDLFGWVGFLGVMISMTGVAIGIGQIFVPSEDD